MILVRLQGGLGNQMFQYAFAQVLAVKNNTKVVLDNDIYALQEKKIGYTPRNFELTVFNNNYVFAQKNDIRLFSKLSLYFKLKKKLKFNYPKKFQETSFEYSLKANRLKSPVLLVGYFQSFKYFVGFESYIKKLFTFPIHELSKENNDLMSFIKNNNTISVHIRRGDYVTDFVTNQVHGTCDMDYYLKAISLITAQSNNPILVFFSDDLDWVKEKFEHLVLDKIFVTNNQGQNSWVDMFLMSLCTHNIIANSSFSWWGAWLNENKQKKIIAPKKWYRSKEIDIHSIIPEEWIII